MNRPMRTDSIVALLILLAGGPVFPQATDLAFATEEVEVSIAGLESALIYLEIPPAPGLVPGGPVLLPGRLAPVVPLPTVPDPSPKVGFTLADVGDALSVIGTFGGATANSVLGSLEVTRFGDGPEFRFSYEQDRSDGGWEHTPGTGFLTQVNALESRVSFGSSRKGIDAAASFHNRQAGLQGRSHYFSADLRSISGSIEGVLAPSESIRFSAGLAGGDHRRVLSVTDRNEAAPILSRTEVAPFLLMELTFPRVTIETRAKYSGNWYTGFETDPLHIGALSLSGEFVLWPGIRMLFSGEAGYIVDIGPVFPASLELEADISRSFLMSAAVRREVRAFTADSVWDSVPALDVTPVAPYALEPVEGLTGELNGEWRIFPERFSITGGAFYGDWTDVRDIGDFDQTTGLVPLSIGNSQKVITTAGGRMTWGNWNGDLYWKQNWLDRGTMDPATEAGLSVAYNSDKFRFYLDTVLPIFDAVDVPIINTRVEVAIAPDAFITLFVEDGAGPFLDTERTVYGAFIDNSYPFADIGPRVGATVSVRF